MLSSITFQGLTPKKINNTNAALSSKNKEPIEQKPDNQNNIRFNPPFYKPLAFKGIEKQITDEILEEAIKKLGDNFKNLDIVASEDEKNEGKIYLVRGPFLLDPKKQLPDRENEDGNRSYQVFNEGKIPDGKNSIEEVIGDMKNETRNRMTYLKENLGIDTVISLQCPGGRIEGEKFKDFLKPETEFQEDINIEKEIADELKIKFVHIPISPVGTAEKKQIDEFFSEMKDVRKNEKRAYVHCKSGKDRTGVMSAIYLRELGVSKDDVYKNHASEFKPISNRCEQMSNTVKTYQPTDPFKIREKENKDNNVKMPYYAKHYFNKSISKEVI